MNLIQARGEDGPDGRTNSPVAARQRSFRSQTCRNCALVKRRFFAEQKTANTGKVSV